MVEFLPESAGNIIGVRISGKLTDQDYKEILIPRMDELVKEYEKVRCLLYMDEGFTGWEPAAMSDDAAFMMKHKESMEKIAVVGGPKWIEWGSKIIGLLIKGELESFHGDQLEEAWTWIKS